VPVVTEWISSQNGGSMASSTRAMILGRGDRVPQAKP
jgi:hypothetical protein